MVEIKGKYTDAKIFASTIEEGVYSQVYDIINCEAFKGKKVVCMPDVHVGASGPCGLVAEIGDFVCPEHVGVDIGCEVSTMLLNKKIDPKDYGLIEHKIRKSVPMGFEIHNYTIIDEKEFMKWMGNWFAKFKAMQPEILNNLPSSVTEKYISNVLNRIGMDPVKFWHSIGTVGGGNHYIEYDEDNEHCMMNFHFGSRNFGLKVCKYWTNIAKSNKIDKKVMKELTKEFKASYVGDMIYFKDNLDKYIASKLPKTIPGYISGDDMKGYLCDMVFAMGYARYNHIIVEKIVEKILNKFSINVINKLYTTHNYIDFRDFTLRKSAISAYKDEIVLVPFNMRDGVAICKGIGNSEWLNSCAHGAGRKMSRSAAKSTLSLQEFEDSMKGIYTTTANMTTIDEAPAAYKDTDEIKELIQNTVEIIGYMKPKINIKAAE
ncbi:MAG: RtcB family protein [Clostridia bacterium]|nr:RtcB family protein [Clostridia bacterium]